MNKGTLAFLSGAGFAFLGAYLWWFTWLKPVLGYAVASTLIGAFMVPLALVGFIRPDVKAGFFGGLLAASAAVVITISFVYTGNAGLHALVSWLVACVSVLLLLYSMKPSEISEEPAPIREYVREYTKD